MATFAQTTKESYHFKVTLLSYRWRQDHNKVFTLLNERLTIREIENENFEARSCLWKCNRSISLGDTEFTSTLTHTRRGKVVKKLIVTHFSEREKVTPSLGNYSPQYTNDATKWRWNWSTKMKLTKRKHTRSCNEAKIKLLIFKCHNFLSKKTLLFKKMEPHAYFEEILSVFDIPSVLYANLGRIIQNIN